jgi:hypothetical protein
MSTRDGRFEEPALALKASLLKIFFTFALSFSISKTESKEGWREDARQGFDEIR